MGEDDMKKLFWKSGQVVPSSQTQIPTVPPTILPGSGESNAPPPLLHQNLEISSWLHHPNRQDYFCSGVASTHPQSSISLAPPLPPPLYAPHSQIMAERMAENYMNFSTLRENVFTGDSVEAGPLIPVVRESTQVSSSTFSATGTYLTPATFIGGVSSTFAVPSRGQKDKAVAIQTAFEIAATSTSCAETEPVQIQPATETEIADERKPKERQETFAAIQGIEEASGSTSRKRSRAAEMHNLSERRRRENINEKMKTLQELIPGCSKNDKASMLDDVIHYVKSLQTQVEMMSMGYGTYGVMQPMMYEGNMQRYVPHMAMCMNRPPPFVTFPREARTPGLTPSYQPLHHPFPNIQASDPSRVPLPSLQPGSYPVSNQPQFPVYMNPYSQFVGLHQMQESQQSFREASCSKDNQLVDVWSSKESVLQANHNFEDT